MKLHIIFRDMMNEEVEIDDNKLMPLIKDLQDPDKAFVFFKFPRREKQALINKRDIIKVEWRLDNAHTGG